MSLSFPLFPVEFLRVTRTDVFGYPVTPITSFDCYSSTWQRRPPTDDDSSEWCWRLCNNSKYRRRFRRRCRTNSRTSNLNGVQNNASYYGQYLLAWGYTDSRLGAASDHLTTTAEIWLYCLSDCLSTSNSSCCWVQILVVNRLSSSLVGPTVGRGGAILQGRLQPHPARQAVLCRFISYD